MYELSDAQEVGVIFPCRKRLRWVSRHAFLVSSVAEPLPALIRYPEYTARRSDPLHGRAARDRRRCQGMVH
jgi:hypothetical protein